MIAEFVKGMFAEFLGWAMSYLQWFMVTYGIAGIVIVGAGVVLTAVTIGHVFRFCSRPTGIATLVAVIAIAFGWMYWQWMKPTGGQYKETVTAEKAPQLIEPERESPIQPVMDTQIDQKSDSAEEMMISTLDTEPLESSILPMVMPPVIPVGSVGFNLPVPVVSPPPHLAAIRAANRGSSVASSHPAASHSQKAAPPSHATPKPVRGGTLAHHNGIQGNGHLTAAQQHRAMIRQQNENVGRMIDHAIANGLGMGGSGHPAGVHPGMPSHPAHMGGPTHPAMHHPAMNHPAGHR